MAARTASSVRFWNSSAARISSVGCWTTVCAVELSCSTGAAGCGSTLGNAPLSLGAAGFSPRNAATTSAKAGSAVAGFASAGFNWFPRIAASSAFKSSTVGLFNAASISATFGLSDGATGSSTSNPCPFTAGLFRNSSRRLETTSPGAVASSPIASAAMSRTFKSCPLVTCASASPPAPTAICIPASAAVAPATRAAP